MKKKIICNALVVSILASSFAPISHIGVNATSNKNITIVTMNTEEDICDTQLGITKLKTKDELTNYKAIKKSSKKINANKILNEIQMKKSLAKCKKVDKKDNKKWDWNFKMLSHKGALQSNAQTSASEKVKVAIVDSGVNFSTDIDVKERKDFINNAKEEDISVLYEDFSGHGTNIAGVIAAKNNDQGATGGNPNVELYSAKVLDENNEAPITRVVEAIDWAIEKKVNIINFSFVTTIDSEALRNSVKRAYDAGVLMVAASGNKGYVGYPAAYPEVMSVGSVNNNGELSEFSPKEGAVEILAPGELITSTDVFGTVSTHSGTSYAAPHITAIASKLWERDTTMSANYVRSVLDISANLVKRGKQYGYGLVDYDFACSVFDALKPYGKYNDNLEQLMDYAINSCGVDNPNFISVNDMPAGIVEGAWGTNNDGEYEHMALLDGLNVKNQNGRAIIMAGCIYADRSGTKLNGMYVNPYFHGYAFYNEQVNEATKNHQKYIPTNYLAGILYLSRMASSMVRGSLYTLESIYVKVVQNNTEIYKLNNIINHTYLHKSDVTWSSMQSSINSISASKSGGRTNGINFNANDTIHRGLFMYGLTLHAIGDMFAHCSAKAVTENGRTYWQLINHNTYNNNPDLPTEADNVNYLTERNQAAEIVCKRALCMVSNMGSSTNTSTAGYSTYGKLNMSIFDLSNYDFNSFRLINFDLYAKQVCKSSGLFSPDNEIYYNNSNYWQRMDAGVYKNAVITSGMPFFNPTTKQFQSSYY